MNSRTDEHWAEGVQQRGQTLEPQMLGLLIASGENLEDLLKELARRLTAAGLHNTRTKD